MSTPTPTITDILDTFTTLVTNQNTISLDLGATGRLNTNEDSDVTSSINELELGIRGTSNNLVATDLTDFTANNIVSALHELDSDLHGAGGGNAKADLTTNANDIVSGINELELGIRGTDNGLVAAILSTTANDLVSAVGELDSDIGARPHTGLTTTAKNLTAAINEHDAELGTITALAMGTTASTVSTAIKELEVEIDTLNTFVEPTQALTTTATTVADAINEHDAEIGAATLATSATTLRGAINELHTELGSTVDSDGIGNLVASNIGASLRLLDSAVGNLDDLSTDITATGHNNLVSALNVIQADIEALDANGVAANQALGLLADLNSAFVGSERTNFVNALNALRADIPLIYDVNGTQLN
jgi:hypothetical protein